MLKREELTTSGCLSKADDDEMIFVLLARDPCASVTVDLWCDMRVATGKNKEGDQQIVDAREVARVMGHHFRRRILAKAGQQ